MNLDWACAADAALLAQGHALAFDPPWDAQAFAELLAGPGVQGLLVRDGDRLAGLALIRTVASEMEILTLGVDPTARRSGIARALMTAALGAARQSGAETCFLEVAADNAPAIALYRGLGFQRTGVRRAYYDRGAAGTVDALVMQLDLRASEP